MNQVSFLPDRAESYKPALGLSESLQAKMFSWGEDSQQGFRLRDRPTGDRVHFLNLRFHITDLSAGDSAIAFVKSDGEASIIRVHESEDGRRSRGKQSERQPCVSVCVWHVYLTLFFVRLRSRRYSSLFFLFASLIHCHLLCFCGLCTYRAREMSGEDSGCEL